MTLIYASTCTEHLTGEPDRRHDLFMTMTPPARRENNVSIPARAADDELMIEVPLRVIAASEQHRLRSRP